MGLDCHAVMLSDSFFTAAMHLWKVMCVFLSVADSLSNPVFLKSHFYIKTATVIIINVNIRISVLGNEMKLYIYRQNSVKVCAAYTSHTHINF